MQQYGAGSEGEGRITGQGVSDCVVSADRESYRPKRAQAEVVEIRGEIMCTIRREKQTKHNRADS